MSELKPISDVTCVLSDYGTFLSVGERLARDFKKVYFYKPAESEYLDIQRSIIGQGIEGVECIESLISPTIIEEADLFVFPDRGMVGAQRYLRSIGKAVFGSFEAAYYEEYRTRFLKLLEELNLPMAPSKTIIGLTALAEHLKTVKDKWVKINKWRSQIETFHHFDYDHSRRDLERMAIMFGGAQEMVAFVVQDSIPDAQEIGYDGFCIDGQYPDKSFAGYELKNKLYLGSWLPNDELPEQVLKINEAIADKMKEIGYRNFMATEIRVQGDTGYFIDPTCYSEDTEVLTNSGWKLFKDLSGEELFCTLNPKTNQIEYHRATAQVQYRYDGEMILMSNRQKSMELLVTPNHSVWFRRKPHLPLIECRADSLHGTAHLIPRTGDWNGVEVPNFTIPSYSKTWKSGKGKGVMKTCAKPEIQIPMDDWLRFLAVFLSEGCCHNDWQVQISQTKYCDEFINILSKLPFKFTRHKKGFTISDVQLNAFLRNTGLRHERGVPEYVKMLSRRQIDIFLNAYTLGDGSRSNKNRRITTTSQRTADDVQELFLKAGSVASIRTSKKAGDPIKLSGGKYTSKHDALIIGERSKFKDYFCEGWDSKMAHQYLSKQEYHGTVYDVEVPNHILYVRRNGKPCWSGNCRMPGQTGEHLTETMTNIAEVIWNGSNGIMVNPKFSHRFAAEATLHYTAGSSDDWKILSVPEAVERNTKLYHYFRTADGMYHFPPARNDEVGVICANGNTIEEAIDNIKKIFEEFKNEPLSIDFAGFADLLSDIKKAEKAGNKFSDQKVPKPEIAL